MSVFVQSPPRNVAQFNSDASKIELSQFITAGSDDYSLEFRLKYEESVILNSLRGGFLSCWLGTTKAFELQITPDYLGNSLDHALNIYMLDGNGFGNDNLYFNFGLVSLGIVILLI